MPRCEGGKALEEGLKRKTENFFGLIANSQWLMAKKVESRSLNSPLSTFNSMWFLLLVGAVEEVWRIDDTILVVELTQLVHTH